MKTIRLSPDPNADDIPEEIKRDAEQVFSAMQHLPTQEPAAVDWDRVFPGLQQQGRGLPTWGLAPKRHDRPRRNVGASPEAGATISTEQLQQVFPGLRQQEQTKQQVGHRELQAVPVYLPPPTGPGVHPSSPKVGARGSAFNSLLLVLVLILLLFM